MAQISLSFRGTAACDVSTYWIEFKLLPRSNFQRVLSCFLAPFDASDHLDSEKAIAYYLTTALENPGPDAFLVAVRDVAKARGISKVPESAGLGHESLYKALKPGAQPRFDTVRRLLEALGVRLDVVSPHSQA